MSNFSLYSKLSIALVTAIAAIVVGCNFQFNNLERPNSLQTPIVRSNSQAEPNETSGEIADSNSQAEPNEMAGKVADPNSQAKPVKSAGTDAKTSSVNVAAYKTTLAFERYRPKYAMTAIHPSNYGDRYSTDIYGNSLNNLPLVVLHETTDSAASAINTFKTAHQSDSKQVSYHALIALDGTIVYLLTSDKRAFGAGNSAFEGAWGIETVKTNPNLPSSVNNFAYHISLETPVDGRGNSQYHSGYTESQYKSLAWLIAQSNIPDNRITTHKNVDRSGQKIDPRSFDFDRFFTILHEYRQPIEEMSTNEAPQIKPGSG